MTATERQRADALAGEAPQPETGESGDGPDGDDEGADGVGADPVGVVEVENAGDGACNTEEEDDHAGRVLLCGGLEVQLGDGKGDQRQACEDADRIYEVSAVELMFDAIPGRGEDREPEVIALAVLDFADGEVVDGQLGEAKLEASKDEERGQRDDEAGQPRSFHHGAVEPPEGKGNDERKWNGDPQA